MPVKKLLAASVAATLVAAPIAQMDVQAASKYTLKKGKLIVKKTGKRATGSVIYKKTLYKNGVAPKGFVVYKSKLYKNGIAPKGYAVYKSKLYKDGVAPKGYVVYKSKLYKNGKPNKGYAIIGEGSKMKLYYGATLKKGYKKAYDKTVLFKNGVIVKEIKQTMDETRLYKDGFLYKGTHVYENLDGELFLYKDGLLATATKTATYSGVERLFVEGRLSTETQLFDNKLFVGGKPNVGLVLVKDVYYYGPVVANGIVNDVRYIDGVMQEGQIDEAARALAEKEGLVVAYTSDYVKLNSIGTESGGNTTPEIKPSSVKVKSVDDIQTFIKTYENVDLNTLAATEKQRVLEKAAQFKAERATDVQQAVTEYVNVAKTFTNTIAASAHREKNPETFSAWQNNLKDVQTKMKTIQTSVASVEGVTMDTAAFDEAFEVASTTVETFTKLVALPTYEVIGIPYAASGVVTDLPMGVAFAYGKLFILPGFDQSVFAFKDAEQAKIAKKVEGNWVITTVE